MTGPVQETTGPGGDPFTALQPVQLRPTGQGGVFAVCLAHAGEVHALAVNTFDKPVSLGELAYSVREHLAEQHQGPPLCVCPTEDGAERNEGCPEHGYVARRLHDAGEHETLMNRARVALGGLASGDPVERTDEQVTVALFHALTKARAALQGVSTQCWFHGGWPLTERGATDECPSCAQTARVRAALAALDVFKPAPAEVTA